MSKIYKEVSRIAPSAQDGSYLYAVVPTADNGLATITSGNELAILNRTNLASSPILRVEDVPKNVTCLVRGDVAGNTLLCSGSDGVVARFDVRSQQKTGSFQMDRAVTAIASTGNTIAAGTELAHHTAIVSLWDARQNRQIWQNTENNDDITTVDFHPSKSQLLLCGGDDGQLGLFDTHIAEEDDSLIQGVNQGPVHKAGFLGDARFFGLSSDQNLSVYPVSTPDDEDDPVPILLGDLRPVLECEYVIDVFRNGDNFVVAAGSNQSDQRVDLVELKHATNPKKTPKLKLESRHTLQKAHGEEVVRSILADDKSGSVFTAGEDGYIRCFSFSGSEDKLASEPRTTKFKKGSQARYTPY